MRCNTVSHLVKNFTFLYVIIPLSSSSLVCSFSGSHNLQCSAHRENDDHTSVTSMTSILVSMRGLPLALASMTQVATSESRFHPKWRAIAVVTMMAVVLMFYLHRTVEDTGHTQNGIPSLQMHSINLHGQAAQKLPRLQRKEKPYNDTYPLSPPQRTKHGARYRIGVIADLDTASRSPKEQTWFSYMKRGYLTLSDSGDRLQVEWDTDVVTLESHLAEKGRGKYVKVHHLLISNYIIFLHFPC